MSEDGRKLSEREEKGMVLFSVAARLVVALVGRGWTNQAIPS